MELLSTYWRRLWLFCKFLCSTFSKGTFNFIKRNIIRKLVKNIIQSNEGLIVFFGNSKIRFLKISWLNCEQYGNNQYKKKEHNFEITFKIHSSIDNSNHFYLFILSWKGSREQKMLSWKFKTSSWITNHDPLNVN